MVTIGELVDQGIRAYVEGRLDDARHILDEVLQRDPANARARSYLILIHGGLEPGPAASRPGPPAVVAVPAPPPAAVHALDDYAPSPWDDGPAAGATLVRDADGGIDADAVAEKSDLRPLVPEAPAAPAAPPGKSDVEVWMAAAKDLHALGDFSGSLELIEKILKVDPEHGEARDYLRHNEATLVAMYESKLGPLVAVPRLAIKPEEVMWLNLDHRAGFLLSQIDGSVDFDALFALSGLPRLDTARILATLIADGVIAA
jgi:tetratricopeptide (TPR) repeat protein